MLRVDGGLTRSRLLMQAQADLLQAPVEVCPAADATALGVAALARLGTGEAATLAERPGSGGARASDPSITPIRPPNGGRASALSHAAARAAATGDRPGDGPRGKRTA